MWKSVLLFLGGILTLAIPIITTTRREDAVTNALTWWPTLPAIVRIFLTAIGVMVGGTCIVWAVIRMLGKKPIDELGELKAPMAALRIEMENDPFRTSVETYKQKTETLRAQVASMIAEVSGNAAADNYLTCGNLIRRVTPNPHQLNIDVLIRDLDYLDRFIDKHTSR